MSILQRATMLNAAATGQRQLIAKLLQERTRPKLIRPNFYGGFNAEQGLAISKTSLGNRLTGKAISNNTKAGGRVLLNKDSGYIAY